MTTTVARPGLRERKKIKLHLEIKREALRLFLSQGFEQTTVEQIADAAETSTTTFYRIFSTKEDVVFDDNNTALIAQHLATLPDEAPLMDVLRSAVAAVVAAADANQEELLTRLQLIADVPALHARQAYEEHKTYELFLGLLADKLPLASETLRLRLVAAALTSTQLEAARYWADQDGKQDLQGVMMDALSAAEPLIAALEGSARPTATARARARRG